MSNQDTALRDAIRLKVKNDYGMDLTEEDIDLCVHEMETRKVSIFHNQIYPNKRSRSVWNPKARESEKTFFVRWELTIDGARAIAHRHGLCGIDAPVFEEENGRPTSAKITVYRRGPRGERYPFVGFVLYEEFVQKYYNKDEKKFVPNTIWKNSPFNQLAKCAESQALRRGFQELGEDDPFLASDDDGLPTSIEPPEIDQNQALDELAELSQEMGGYEELENPLVKEPVKVFSLGGFFQDKKIIDYSRGDGIQKLVLDGGIKVDVFDDGKVNFENAFDVPLAPPPPVPDAIPEPAVKTIETMREFCLPLLKAWCASKNNGKKVSYKDAYKNLLGVIVKGDMTVNDYENLAEQLREELGK